MPDKRPLPWAGIQIVHDTQPGLSDACRLGDSLLIWLFALRFYCSYLDSPLDDDDNRQQCYMYFM